MATALASHNTAVSSPHDGRTAARRRRDLLPILIGAAGTGFLVLLWEVLAVTGTISANAFPSAREVIRAILELMTTEIFWNGVGATLFSTFIGLLLSICLATPVAIALGRWEGLRIRTGALVEFLKPIPPIALLPLALLFWGPTEPMKLALIVYGAFWPLLTQLIYGIQQVDSAAIDMARTHRLSRWQTTSRIVIPSMLPFTLTGIRVAVSIGLVVSIVTEMIGGASGIGQQISLAHTAHALPTMYGLIVSTGILGLLLNQLVAAIERPILFWHPSQRADKGEK